MNFVIDIPLSFIMVGEGDYVWRHKQKRDAFTRDAILRGAFSRDAFSRDAILRDAFLCDACLRNDYL